MDFLSVLSFVPTLVVLLLIACSTLVIRIFSGKSIRSNEYYPVAGTIYGLAFHWNRLHDYLGEVVKRHGTFRLLVADHSEIYTKDVRVIEHILKTNFEKYPKGQYNHDIETELFGQGIFSVNGAKWRQQRKLASHEFSTRVLRDFSCKIFRKKAANLVSTVSEFSTASKTFDVHDLLMKFTLDSIFKVGFGVDLGSLEGSSKATAFIKAFDDSNALTFQRHIDPIWKLKRFLNIGSEASLKKNIKIIQDFVQKLINKKREQTEKRINFSDKEDILSRFLVESTKDPEMNDQYLRDIILNFMIAGKDTTGNTLSWFLYVLCLNPLLQEKLVQEINIVVGDQGNKASAEDFLAAMTDEILEKMHYLHAALTETLRLFPAVPLDGRCADMDDILPDGYKLRKGDSVYYLAYAMGRSQDIWGDDAEDFRPERWLVDGTFKPESPFKFVSFHAGPRICLGKDFAYRQMKIVSIALLHYFRFKLADDDRNKNVTYRTMMTLQIEEGLHLRAHTRQT
ncbi:cytochrome P450 704C1-like [Apium graveolens]|uniref:cytochrome P450 704C1-like n=1 Tax=Apium graveolens TaxID=4045 RepID=UPI003D794855